jgi:hypothetical protein
MVAKDLQLQLYRIRKYVIYSKLTTYLAPFLILTALTNCLPQAHGDSMGTKANSPLLDVGYLPATADQIQDNLRRSPNNALALYGAVYQAAHNGLELAAYADLRKLVQADPDNPNLLAAYCLSYGVASGYYRMNWHHRALGNVYNESDQMEYDKDLAKAEKLDPNLWLIYLLKAQPAIFPGHEDRIAALGYLRKAVKLAPNITYTHYSLAYGLMTGYPTALEKAEATREDEIAVRLKPVNAQAAWLLFEMHGIFTPNRQKGLAAKKLFLSELPPGYKVSSAELGFLDNFPK